MFELNQYFCKFIVLMYLINTCCHHYLNRFDIRNGCSFIDVSRFNLRVADDKLL